MAYENSAASRTFNQDRPSFKKMKPTKGDRQPLSRHDLVNVKAMTETQKRVFQTWRDATAMVMYGSAGTGKTFLALYLALYDLLSQESTYDHIVIVRSAVPTREIGFLPGTMEEKIMAYEEPYRIIVAELTGKLTAYDKFKEAGRIEFTTTSFLRGTTFNNALVIFDEFQNATFHELDTAVTRIGLNTKLILCGDTNQNDLNGKSGFHSLLEVLQTMPAVTLHQFLPADIVRSGFVKDYILAKEKVATKT